jgi:8-oxo-dGTP pyrophosphatase MutT (NUDIX family)
MGGGILPVAHHNGEVYLLFGQEVDDGMWSDFGGGRENRETPYQTAIREGVEELSGFLGSSKQIIRLVKKNSLGKVFINGYTTFLFEVNYDPKLPAFFNNNFRFIESKLPHLINKDGLFEKKAVQWFPASTLNRKKRIFRPFYRAILNEIVERTKSD